MIVGYRRVPAKIMFTRYCLQKSTMRVNVFVNIVGAAMIIYSLWLMKKWNHGVSKLPSPSSVTEPWFIYSCLGVGIVVCLGTLLGYVVSHYMSNSVLATYIGSICALLLIQGFIIIMVFFEIDWDSTLSKSIDDSHKEFKKFFLFHVKVSCLITIGVFIAQIIVAFLVIILWSVGREPNLGSRNPNPPNAATQSFLVDHNLPLLENS